MLDKKTQKEDTCLSSEAPSVSASPKPVDVVENHQRALRLARIARNMSRSNSVLASVKAALDDLRQGRVQKAEDLEREFLTVKTF